MKGNTYQLVLALNPKLEEKASENILKSVSGWVEETGAKAKKPKVLGSKNLEYAILGHRKANFWEMDVTSTMGWKLADFNLYLNRESSIIRYLVLKK